MRGFRIEIRRNFNILKTISFRHEHRTYLGGVHERFGKEEEALADISGDPGERAMGAMSDLNSSRAVVNALKGLQDKIRCLEDERTRSLAETQTLKEERRRRKEDSAYRQQVHDLTMQEQDAASRLAYERLLADKGAVDVCLDETEEVRAALKDECGAARDCEQEAIVAQMSAEAKMAVLEGQFGKNEEKAKARESQQSRAKAAVRRETAAADADRAYLTSHVEILQRTLRRERFNRRACETKTRRAQAATACTNRYLQSLLRINQELVSKVTITGKVGRTTLRSSSPRSYPSTNTRARGVSSSQPSRLRRRKAAEAATATVQGKGRGTSTQRLSDNVSNIPRTSIDVDDALGQTFEVAHAGGDPVACLQALYERVGFDALQEDAASAREAYGGTITTSLPTSPSAQVYKHDCSDNEVRSRGESIIDESPQAMDFGGHETFYASEASIKPPRSLGLRPGCGRRGRIKLASGGSTQQKGRNSAYSFACSPRRRAVSVAQRCPQVVRRLEDLAVQLDRERADVQNWYKTVVDQAKEDFDGSGRAQKQGKHLDAGSLTTAIACLQDKSQQLDVVRKSLRVLKSPPEMAATLSPTDSRRKVAAFQVLRACAEA